MPKVEFEPKILVFQRAKTVHALDRGDTMIGFVDYRSVFYNIRQI
jgi:hypothetical protein